jgi:NAD(P)-dependent dehydrogenase (short-subunit alcohol dehydrogenase family)/3-oxoacyl-(acyl-carrier-protein) synthase
MVLDAAEQALTDAGCVGDKLDSRTTGVVAGTEFGGDFLRRLHLLLRLPKLDKTVREVLAAEHVAPPETEAVVQSLLGRLQERWPGLLDETGRFSASSLAVRIAKTWDLMGGGAAVDSGSTSGLSALSAACDMLLGRDNDLMICVGAQRDLGQTQANAPSSKGLKHVPFDRDSDGAVRGEGAVVLALRRLSDARRDGNSVYAVVRDIHGTRGQPGLAIREALEAVAQSVKPAGNIAFVVADAAGDPQSDQSIATSLNASLAAGGGPEPIPVTSLAGQVGHVGGASSLVSVITAIAAFCHRTVPAIPGLVNPVPIAGDRRLCAVPDGSPVRLPGPSETPLVGVVVGCGQGLVQTAALEEPPPDLRKAEVSQAVLASPAPAATEETEPPRVTPSMARGERDPVAHRSVLRLADSPRAEAVSLVPNGDGVLVIGSNEPAVALAHRLIAMGTVVHHWASDADGQQLRDRIESLPAQPPVRHVFVTSALDDACLRPIAADVWPAQRQVALELPFVALQGWVRYLQKHNIRDNLSVTAVTGMGGDLGLGDHVLSPLGGWIAGTLKSLRVELKRNDHPASIKVCDFGPHDSPTRIVDATLDEWLGRDADVEIALGENRRRVVRVVRQPVDLLPQRPLRAGGTWVITGGARGITAEVAVALGRKYNLTMHLIGRSPAPDPKARWRNCSDEQLKTIKRSIVRQAIADKHSPEKQWERVKTDIEIHDNLRRMLELGLNVTYHSCDVSDFDAVRQTLATIRQQSGPITGVIHGAGYARTSRFELQKRDELAKTIGAKVDGAVALMSLTADDPLRYFVGFGSISGRFGGNGLADYGAANEMLAKLCAWYRAARPSCATTCIDWQSWDEVGMAMLPDSTVGTRGVLKMKFLPPAEGVEHLDRELTCLLYTSPSPRDRQKSRMPSSA